MAKVLETEIQKRFSDVDPFQPYNPRWMKGIVGIVASRLIET